MIIIKKSGKKEDFSVEKLTNSIVAASKEANEPIDERTLKRIIAEFQLIVKGKNLITTQQIDVIVYGLLYSKGYYGTLNHYVSYHKKRQVDSEEVDDAIAE